MLAFHFTLAILVTLPGLQNLKNTLTITYMSKPLHAEFIHFERQPHRIT